MAKFSRLTNKGISLQLIHFFFNPLFWNITIGQFGMKQLQAVYVPQCLAPSVNKVMVCLSES